MKSATEHGFNVVFNECRNYTLIFSNLNMFYTYKLKLIFLNGYLATASLVHSSD